MGFFEGSLVANQNSACCLVGRGEDKGTSLAQLISRKLFDTFLVGNYTHCIYDEILFERENLAPNGGILNNFVIC
jgi:hypothetical protein